MNYSPTIDRHHHKWDEVIQVDLILDAQGETIAQEDEEDFLKKGISMLNEDFKCYCIVTISIYSFFCVVLYLFSLCKKLTLS